MKKLLKAIYNIIPFKKEMFSAMKVLGVPKESIYKHLHFKGQFKVSVNENESFKIYHPGFIIENEIFWEGLLNKWEKISLKLWIELCRKSTTIVDIGANTGVYSLVAKSVAPKSNVYAFEPHQLFYPFLKKNNDINNFDIACLNKAVSDKDGIVVLGDYTGEFETLTFESISLDQFIEQNGIKKIDLMKIDVERHEPEVLRGYSNFMVQHRPTILIEILDDDISESINKIVAGLGYLYFNIDENGQIRQTSKIEKSDFYNYLLCSEEIALSLGLVK